MSIPNEEIDKVITDPRRLSALHQLELLDAPAEESFDRLTRLASIITDSPISLVTIIDADRQFFMSATGLPEPVASTRETPLSHAVCKHVVASGEPLIIEDMRQEDLFKDHPAVQDFNIMGYLGMPLTATDGTELGSFCVLDTKPHEWKERDIKIIRELAISTVSEIELRAQVKLRKKTEAYLMERQNQYQRVYHFAKFTLNNMKDIIKGGSEPNEILVYLADMQKQFDRL